MGKWYGVTDKGTNGQIHPSGFKDAGSCVAQQTRLSLGWTGAKHLSMDLASGPPQQQDSHVLMPHNSTLWLFRIRCDKTLMNCLICDEIRSWLCVDRDQSWCYQPPLLIVSLPKELYDMVILLSEKATRCDCLFWHWLEVDCVTGCIWIHLLSHQLPLAVFLD